MVEQRPLKPLVRGSNPLGPTELARCQGHVVNYKSMKIGVFDSGLGGLSILKSIVKKMPKYSYIYLGDNARVPYGGRSSEIIYQFTKQAVDFLFKNDCQLVILACNSATANALRRLQREYLPQAYPERKILGVIKPTIEYLVEKKRSKVGVIGTYATIESGAYIREILKVLPEAKIEQQSCPLLVPLIEENETGTVLNTLLNKYLTPLVKHPPEVLILACTHYGLIKKPIQAKLFQTKVIDQGQLVAEKLALYLRNHKNIVSKLSRKGAVNYYVTDLNPRFEAIARLFLGKRVKIEKIGL